MGNPVRTGLIALGLGGTCCGLAASCGDLYIGDNYGDVGGWGGGGSASSAVGVGGSGDSSASSTGSSTGSGNICPPEQCVPISDGPSWSQNDWQLLWVGNTDPQQMHNCPSEVPVQQMPDMGADLVPTLCETCGCLLPQGSCELPTKLSASTAACNLPGALTSFDAPIPWDGTCTQNDAIGPGSGVQSLTIEPLVVNDPPTCEPGFTTQAKLEPAHWGTYARACKRAMPYPGECKTPETICTPPVADGFRLCLGKLRKNIVLTDPCPASWQADGVYPRVFYEHFTDNQQCTDCSCGAPVGSTCSTSVSVYTDSCCGCSDPNASALLTVGVNSDMSSCGSVVPMGSALGSKKADTPDYQPGSCQAKGGDLSGTVSLEEDSAMAFCCFER